MTDEANDDVVQHYDVRMQQIDLEQGRSVAVGYAAGTDRVFVRFVNNHGTETKLALSPEAASALHRLLSPRKSGVESVMWQLIATIEAAQPDPSASASAS